MSYFSNLKRSFTISRRVFACKTAATLHLATSVLSMWIMDHKKGHKQDKGLKPWKYILTINASNQLDALGHEWEGSSTRAKERKVLSTIKKCKVGPWSRFSSPIVPPDPSHYDGNRDVGRRIKWWLRNIKEWILIASVEELFGQAKKGVCRVDGQPPLVKRRRKNIFF